MSCEEGKGTKKDGESTAKVIPDEPAVLQELEDRLMDRLLRKVREESGSEELGELKNTYRHPYTFESTLHWPDPLVFSN